MHICSTLGYFSICRKNGGQLRVRSTSHTDLFDLIRYAGLEHISINSAPDTHQGYPYHIVVSEEELAVVMISLTETVSYPTFAAALERSDTHRHRIPFYQALARSMGICVPPQ